MKLRGIILAALIAFPLACLAQIITGPPSSGGGSGTNFVASYDPSQFGTNANGAINANQLAANSKTNLGAAYQLGGILIFTNGDPDWRPSLSGVTLPFFSGSYPSLFVGFSQQTPFFQQLNVTNGAAGTTQPNGIDFDPINSNNIYSFGTTMIAFSNDSHWLTKSYPFTISASNTYSINWTLTGSPTYHAGSVYQIVGNVPNPSFLYQATIGFRQMNSLTLASNSPDISLVNPSGSNWMEQLCFDGAGNIYTAAQVGGYTNGLTGWNCVTKWKADGTFISNLNLNLSISNALGIVFDTNDNNLYVIGQNPGQPNGGAIFQVTTNGRVAQVGPTFGIGGAPFPTGLSFDSSSIYMLRTAVSYSAPSNCVTTYNLNPTNIALAVDSMGNVLVNHLTITGTNSQGPTGGDMGFNPANFTTDYNVQNGYGFSFVDRTSAARLTFYPNSQYLQASGGLLTFFNTSILTTGNAAAVTATIGSLILTNSYTNLSLTASTLTYADANKKQVSLANVAGVLTNDASGNLGYGALPPNLLPSGVLTNGPFTFSPFTNGTTGATMTTNTYYTNTFKVPCWVSVEFTNTGASGESSIFIFNSNGVANPCPIVASIVNIGTVFGATAGFPLDAGGYCAATNGGGSPIIHTNQLTLMPVR